ncbi:ABC transporter C family member 3-like [Mercurialis annua]|uniref:ABC transporter C family member 3-like n=1 Tax=Mercurialis annua TaxID=3986 RepID=UPI00215E1FC2|nr:ABC transporter C family member 3-like [Mercurialis annua]
MEILDLPAFLSSSPPLFYMLLKPIFLHRFSGLLHLVLLLGLFISFVGKKLRAGKVDERFDKNKRVFCYKQTLLCCYGVSLFNLVLCFLIYFYWYRDVWSDDKLMTLLDSAVLKSLSWGALGVYLYTNSVSSPETKFPILLKIWWVFYFITSCYSLIVDFMLQGKHMSLEIQFLVSDVVSVLTGLYICYVGFLKDKNRDSLIEEPFLNGDSSLSNSLESTKPIGSKTLTPYSNASPFSILTFSWMGSLIAVGNKKTLDLEDVPQLDFKDTVAGTFSVLRNKLEMDGGAPANGVTTNKLVKALFLSFWKELLLTALLALLYTVASYVGPYLIESFVQCLDGRGEYKNQGYVLASVFFVAKLVECLSQRHQVFRLQQIGIRIRSVLVAMVYNKGLTLSHLSKQDHTSGEIINYMAVDAERIGHFTWYVHDLWLVFFQVGLALLILYKNLGLGSIAAFISTVIIMLLNYPLGRLQEKFQDKLMESKDNRMKTTSEILRNMRILKLQGWEMKFLCKILDLRKMEEGWLKKYFYTSAVTNFFFWVAPTFISVATFGACMFMGVQLETGKILSALATFRILQEPIYFLPDTISMVVQTKVSLDRIASFLRLQELQFDVIEKLPRFSSDTAIEIVNGNFSWDFSLPHPTLKDVSFKVFRGMNVAVCGAVGSGKSSLLSCILGEVPKISGTLRLCGTKAYVAQSPWIQSGTIEENILFGKKMDRDRYDRILEACALKKDIEILSFGDQTVIGERGINLSGGQKQRIQIARALYQDSDIYLFDDPFSAVDAHTGSHIFKNVLINLLNTRTVIYITHQVEFLPAADIILVMKDGRITQAGKYSDLLIPGSDFMELVNAHRAALSPLDSKQASHPENGSTSKESSFSKAVLDQDKIDLANDKENEIVVPKGQLIQEEEREKGRVGFTVYWKYITTAFGGALVPIILLAAILSQILQICSNYWMAWATPESKDVKPVVTASTLIGVYAAFALGSSFCLLVRITLLVTAGYKTATLLFNKMHYSIFRAPMSFFDATPSGRILNRASTDQSQIDLQMAYQTGAVVFTLIQLLGVVGVMSQVAWQIFVIFIPVACVCIWYQQYYIPSARELARLAGVSKAPVFQHFSETISGSTTIRSFDQQSRFQEINMKLMDAYSRPKFHIAGAMEWLCFRLDIFSSITFATSLILLISFQDRINPAIAGLAVTYGLNLNIIQTWFIWKLCNLENRIISVERVLQYLSIPSEPPLLIEEKRPDQSWPSLGEVSIDNLQVRYAPHMPLVLQGLTCSFPGGKRTGIVGRTGSGKSTLIQTLLRIVEPTVGQIVIDDINISSIGLHDLRSRLGIIPQDPTMFEGTIRSNLDPLEEYTDEQIWEALDKCQLAHEVKKKEKRLDSMVTENGENWSMGQRQLVCLGRVLLKKCKILILDEATASVDTATDNLIQQTIKQHFSDRTVVTIAHRITSVLDSDVVLLLSNGLIEEFDSPARLLQNKSSSFGQLVAEYTMRSNASLEKFT